MPSFSFSNVLPRWLHFPTKASLLQFYQRVKSVIKQVIWFYDPLSKLFLTAVVLLLVYAFILEYLRSSYTVEPFDVPKAWTERGMTGKVVAERVMSGTEDITQTLEGNNETFGLSISVKEDIGEEDIEVGGFNLRSLFRYIKRITGKVDRRIRGSITEQDSIVHLTLSITDVHTVAFTGPSNRKDSLLLLASEYTLQQINPYALGRYFVVRAKYDKAFEQVGYIRTHFGEEYQITALNLWGSIQRNQRQLGAALSKYDEMIRIAPKDPRGYLGKLRIASIQLQDRLKKSPSDTAAIRTLRQTIDKCAEQALKGDITGTVFGGNRDAARKNTLSAVYYEVGYMYYVLKEYKKALPYLQEGVEMMPANYNVHNLMAYCHMRMHNGNEAEKAIREAIFLKPNNGNLWDSYAEIMAELKKEDDYYYCFEQACRCTKDPKIVSNYASDPRWGYYVRHSRFKEIMRRYGLPQPDSIATHRQKLTTPPQKPGVKLASK